MPFPRASRLATLSLCIFCAAHAQTENLVRNGNFEQFPTEWVSFNDTQHWKNRGSGKEKVNARKKDLGDGVRAAGYQAIVNDRYTDATGQLGNVAHTQNTQHTIQSGESYILDYTWRTGSGWQKDRDIVRFVLYATTANTDSGPVVWSAILDSGKARQPGTWEQVSHLTEVVPEAIAGKQLFIMFYGVDTHGESPIGHAAVDNIVLRVAPAR